MLPDGHQDYWGRLRFTIDKYENVPTEIKDESLIQQKDHYKVTWNSKPDLNEWNWLQATYKKLKKINLNEAPPYIPVNAIQYIQSLTTVFEQAILMGRS